MQETCGSSPPPLVAMLGLLGLRIFEATGADIADRGEEHGQRARQDLDRHPNYILTAHLVSGT
jgi:integrase/recombinase XerD